MNNKKELDPNERISKSIKVERYLVDWALGTGLSFSTYVRVFLLHRYNEAIKRGDEQARIP